MRQAKDIQALVRLGTCPPEAKISWHDGLVHADRIGYQGDVWALGCVYYEMLFRMSWPIRLPGSPKWFEESYSSLGATMKTRHPYQESKVWHEFTLSLRKEYHFTVVGTRIGPYVWSRMLNPSGNDRPSMRSVLDVVQAALEEDPSRQTWNFLCAP